MNPDTQHQDISDRRHDHHPAEERELDQEQAILDLHQAIHDRDQEIHDQLPAEPDRRRGSSGAVDQRARELGQGRLDDDQREIDTRQREIDVARAALRQPAPDTGQA